MRDFSPGRARLHIRSGEIRRKIYARGPVRPNTRSHEISRRVKGDLAPGQARLYTRSNELYTRSSEISHQLVVASFALRLACSPDVCQSTCFLSP
eukprot:6176720-Pleurochrysis_carterae.AAC.1